MKAFAVDEDTGEGVCRNHDLKPGSKVEELSSRIPELVLEQCSEFCLNFKTQYGNLDYNTIFALDGTRINTLFDIGQFAESNMNLRKQLADDCCDNGFITVICNCLNILMDKVNEQLNNSSNNQNTIDFDQLRITLARLICIFTDASFKPGKIVADTGLIPTLIDTINDEQRQKSWSEDRTTQLLCGISLSILHSLSRNPELKLVLNEAGALEALKFYLAVTDDKIAMTALCAVACLASDSDESDRLLDQFAIIPKMTRILHEAIGNANHRSFGFSAEEIVEALGYLSVNDNNKADIAAGSTVDDLLVILGDSFSDAEQQRAVDCLWTLAFDPEIRQQIEKTPRLLARLDEISTNSNNLALKTKAERMLDFVEQGGIVKATHQATHESSTGGHIFISYSWKNQTIVLKIRELLLNAGYRVWLDIDKMRGSTLEAMAQAVEDAALVLVCYSEHYRLSNMCRCEAEYMFQMGKPFIPVNMQYHYRPTGWLGIIIGARLYVDMSLVKNDFEIAKKKLSEEIATSLGSTAIADKHLIPSVDGGTNVESKLPECDRCKTLESIVENSKKLCQVPIDLAKVESVRMWSTEEATKWLLDECNISIEDDFCGQSLVGLFEMKQSSPDLYYQTVLQLFKGSLSQCIQLTAALAEILEISPTQ